MGGKCVFVANLSARLRLLASELIKISVEIEQSQERGVGQGVLPSLRVVGGAKIPDSFEDGGLEGGRGRAKKAK